MAEADEFNTGERVYVDRTSRTATIEEHLARYEFASRSIPKDHVVVDAACGSGYGAQILARSARHVVGFDVSRSALKHAAAHHHDPRVSYVRADLNTSLPAGNQTADAVVSFETLEHLIAPEHLIREFARVLRPNGLLILSTPDREVYSDLGGFSNPFHHAELTRSELLDIVSARFNIESVYGQVSWTGPLNRSRIKNAVKKRLPPMILGAVRRISAMRRDQPMTHTTDASVRPIDNHSAGLFYFIVVVAHNR